MLTLLFLYLVVRRISQNRAGSLVAVALLGFSFVFWRAAIMAEVYSLNALIFVLTYWLALQVEHSEPEWSGPPQSRTFSWRDRWLLALGLVIGAGLVHHRTAFILPLVVALWLVLRAGTWRQAGRDLVLTGGMAMLPLLTYLYLPLAGRTRLGQTWVYADTSQWNVFWFVVLGREWWGLVKLPASVASWMATLLTLFRQQATQLTMVGVGLGLTGLLTSRRYWALFGLPLLALTLFGVSYRVVDLDSMLVPLTLTLVIGLGILTGAILSWVGRLACSRPWLGRSATVGVLLATFFWLRPLATTNYAALDLSQDWQAEDLLEEVVAMAETGTPLAIIGQDNSVLPDFFYARTVLDQPVQPLSTTTLARMPEQDSKSQVLAQFEAGRRVLVDRETVDLRMIPWLTKAIEDGTYFLAPTGHPYLWELVPQPPPNTLPVAEPVQPLPAGAFLDGDLSIVGFHQRLLRKRTGCFLRLTLFWRSEADLDEDYFVAVQPTGVATILDNNDHLGLMRGHWPTSKLTAGAVIRDEVDLLVRDPNRLPELVLVVKLYQVQENEFPTFGEIKLPLMVDPADCRG